VTQLELVLEEIIIERPIDVEQNLCADKAYGGQPALNVIISKGYVPHVKKTRRGNPGKKEQPQLESQKMGGGSESFVVQSLPKNFGPI